MNSYYIYFCGETRKNITTVDVLKFCTPKFLIKYHMQKIQTQIRPRNLFPLIKIQSAILEASALFIKIRKIKTGCSETTAILLGQIKKISVFQVKWNFKMGTVGWKIFLFC